MKKMYIALLTLLAQSAIHCSFVKSPIDLTLIGQVKYACSIPRIGIGIADILHNDIAINIRETDKESILTDVPEAVATMARRGYQQPGNVALLYDFLSESKKTPSDLVPPNSYIKIAYSMIESSTIPAKWVMILNEKFDLVVVPDQFLVEVYKNAGVTIPIFVLPHGIYLEGLLEQRMKTIPSKPFTFGLSAGFWERKNQSMLIDAFYAEFGSNPRVRLKLHGRMGGLAKKLWKKIKKLGVKNIDLQLKVLSDAEYFNFISSLDCLVLLSKGEGFSICPREALALGIPAIITDNTAHKTLADTGYFCTVPSLIREKAYYPLHREYLGYDLNCTIADARKALRDVYFRYSHYQRKAASGRTWVEQYLWKNLRKKYLNLVKPKDVRLGYKNEITNDYLMTTSPALYKKYQDICTAAKR